jgi:hypothetical protein
MTKLRVLTVSAPLINLGLTDSTLVMSEGLGFQSSYNLPDFKLNGLLGVQLRISSAVHGITIHGGIMSPQLILDPIGDSVEVYKRGIPMGFLAHIPSVRFTRS